MGEQPEIGDIVKIINKEHIWYEEIGLIAERKIGFVRVEILGSLVWMPNHWVSTIT